MGLTINGNDIVFTGTVTIVNGFDSTTGVAYVVFSPDGGVGSLPFMAQGTAGLPPTLNFTLTEVDPADPLPSPNPAVTTVSAGGAGIASEYNIDMYVHQGETGAAGAFAVLDGTDITGPVTDEYILAKSAGASTVYFTPQRVGHQYVPASIASTSGNSTGRTLASMAIPAQPFNWRPRVFGQCVVSGSANTRVDLVARVGDASAGHQVGYAYGIAGASPPTLTLIPASPAGSDIPGDYGKIEAGAATTVFFRAEQKAATGDTWTTSSSTTTFWVEVAPLPYVAAGS